MRITCIWARGLLVCGVLGLVAASVVPMAHATPKRAERKSPPAAKRVQGPSPRRRRRPPHPSRNRPPRRSRSRPSPMPRRLERRLASAERVAVSADWTPAPLAQRGNRGGRRRAVSCPRRVACARAYAGASGGDSGRPAAVGGAVVRRAGHRHTAQEQSAYRRGHRRPHGGRAAGRADRRRARSGRYVRGAHALDAAQRGRCAPPARATACLAEADARADAPDAPSRAYRAGLHGRGHRRARTGAAAQYVAAPARRLRQHTLGQPRDSARSGHRVRAGELGAHARRTESSEPARPHRRQPALDTRRSVCKACGATRSSSTPPTPSACFARTPSAASWNGWQWCFSTNTNCAVKVHN
jgi:hypothetical protein